MENPLISSTAVDRVAEMRRVLIVYEAIPFEDPL